MSPILRFSVFSLLAILFSLSPAHKMLAQGPVVVPQNLRSTTLLIEYIALDSVSPSLEDKAWHQMENATRNWYSWPHEFIPYEYFFKPYKTTLIPSKYRDTRRYRYILRPFHMAKNEQMTGITFVLIDRQTDSMICDFTDVIWDYARTENFNYPLKRSMIHTLQYLTGQQP